MHSILNGVKNQQLKINAGKYSVKKIELIEVNGKIIYTLDEINARSVSVDKIIASSEKLMVQISTKDNGVVNQK